MLSEDKQVSNLQGLKTTLAQVDAFKARCRAEKKTDEEANGGNPASLQVMDHFLFRCSVESLMKMRSLVARTERETMFLSDIVAVLNNYLQPRKRLAFAEQTKLVAITQTNGESSVEFWAKLRETARFLSVEN